MDRIAIQLTERFGNDLADSKRLYDMPLRGEGHTVNVQYDPYNRRLKFFELTPEDVRANDAIADALREADGGELYSKVIVYARPDQNDGWRKAGLRREAVIWGFFGNGDNAELWTRYPLTLRSQDVRQDEGDRITALAVEKDVVEPVLPSGYTCAPASEADAPEIAKLLAATFKDYPTPISTSVVAAAIRDRTSHFRIVRNVEGELVACASAEIHHTRKSAELTDCATRPDQRGNGLMSRILRALEEDLAGEFGITDVYTIARAYEPGMNCSFAKLGYRYTGRLVNNCRMPDGFESMNVWCRNTREPVEVS
ncbi:MAG: putative beta-lysine N-acetyltransferase [Planctomycetes bacterium]|nr:putative beta-lysine N-acetyltransferase [Planctomycetota bacterium]